MGPVVLPILGLSVLPSDMHACILVQLCLGLGFPADELNKKPLARPAISSVWAEGSFRSASADLHHERGTSPLLISLVVALLLDSEPILPSVTIFLDIKY